jgi:NAD(P)H-hydrate epimerase
MKMEHVLTGAEMASCDARTSEVIGIPSLVLMERAALSVADGVDVFLRKNFPRGTDGRGPLVLAAAGRGNNGADALAAGRILLDRGYHVRFCRLSGKISPESSFAVQERILGQYGVQVEEFPGCSLRHIFDGEADAASGAQIPHVIIDGLFGTGLSRELTGEAAECVAAVNRCRDLYGSYVVAVDIPSGISSDDGQVMGCAVRCDETRTFAFYKRGHFLYPGAGYAGTIHLAQIGITPRAFAREPGMFTLMDAGAADLVPARYPGGNKGTFGKVLIVAGRRNMCGAALLAAQACMAAGAGMVKIFTHEANRLIAQQTLPEALLDTFTEEDTQEEMAGRLRASLAWADIAAAGPAMGTDGTAESILRLLLEYAQEKKALRGLVLDADALRLLARDQSLRELLAGRSPEIPCVLTPHMAEFAALAGKSIGECIAGRTALVREQAQSLRCTIACKDARTLVSAASGRQYLNTTGNSGMAAAGSGDVLTGITAAFLALDFSKKESGPAAEGKLFTEEECAGGFAAAVSAVCLHGTAGDLAARAYGEQGMTARDLCGELKKASFWQA